MSTHLERAITADSVGINTAAVQEMIDDMQRHSVGLHSIMLIRKGKVACEAWQSPLRPDSVHMVYSISKSFLSAAFGFALQEGVVTEATRFLEVFPEYSKKKDPYLEKLKLMHLLSMTAGKRTHRTKTNWMESFVHAAWDFEPGTDFRYVSENYFVVAAALVKKLGMSLTEYLTPRLYEPLGMDVPFWETSPQGVEAGGWGLQLTTEDIAKFILCCHNGGKFDGRQVIPAEWIQRATAFQNASASSQKDADSTVGYGYGFWQCAGMKNTFQCEGLYSQYAISFADQDACLVITSRNAALQQTLDIIWKHMPDVFLPEGGISLPIRIQIAPDDQYTPCRQEAAEKAVSGKTYQLRKQRFIDACNFPISVFPMQANFFAWEKGGDMTNLRFVFDRNGCAFSWTENGGYENTQRLAMDGSLAPGRIRIGQLDLETAGYAFWLNEKTLEVRIHALSAVSTRVFRFTFSGKRITMKPDTIPGMDERSQIMGDKLKTILKGRYFEWWINVLIPRVNNILNPLHRGRQLK